MNPAFPRRSPIILDIEGMWAVAYLVRRVESGVFDAGVISDQSIILPAYAADIQHFLESGYLSALLSIGEHNIAFAEMIQAEARKSYNSQLLTKIGGGRPSVGKESSIIFTPTNKQRPKRSL